MTYLPDRRVLACNYIEATNVAAQGALAYVLLQLGGNLPERVRVLVRSRGGRWVEKWESVRRLGNPRLKTLPPEHPRYDDERLFGEATGDHLRQFVEAQDEMAARASTAPPSGGERSDPIKCSLKEAPMSDTDSLVRFISERLDEDERTARAANPGPWKVDDPGHAETIYAADDTAVVAGGRWGGEASVFDSTADAVHIARHDPARVLREVAAKRRALERHRSVPQDDANPPVGICLHCRLASPCPDVRGLAEVWSDHPDYDPSWTVEA